MKPLTSTLFGVTRLSLKLKGTDLLMLIGDPVGLVRILRHVLRVLHGGEVVRRVRLRRLHIRSSASRSTTGWDAEKKHNLYLFLRSCLPWCAASHVVPIPKPGRLSKSVLLRTHQVDDLLPLGGHAVVRLLQDGAQRLAVVKTVPCVDQPLARGILKAIDMH